MELNVAELNNVNSNSTFDYNNYMNNGEKYWEKEKPKKKKVTFDDILSNMNIVVNNQGVLQFMTPNQNDVVNNEYQNQYHNEYHNEYQNQYQNQYQHQNQYQNQYQHQNQYQNQNQNQYQNQNQNQYQNQNQNQYQNRQPIDTSVKHSYIYNKYFKDYNDYTTENTGPRVPKSIEELKQMLLEDKLRKQRISEIKSKKMLFTTKPNTSINPRNITASKNNLRTMNFK
jgi:hypothetical protein